MSRTTVVTLILLLLSLRNVKSLCCIVSCVCMLVKVLHEELRIIIIIIVFYLHVGPGQYNHQQDNILIGHVQTVHD